MSAKTTIRHMTCLSLLSFMLVGCFQPPFNGFKPDPRPIGSSSISPLLRQKALINILRRQEIEFIQYGDEKTLIIPTDTYFVFDSPHLDDIHYPGLNNIVALIKSVPYGKIYVAGFTDDVGTRNHKDKLTQARAETMLTFLWANNIPAERLKAEGFGDQYAIADNHRVHASAFNRRIEIQWTKPLPLTQTGPAAVPASMMTK